MILLSTKFYPPPNHREVLVRQKLHQELENGRVGGGKLALISAPAGYGKSTLASSYIHLLGNSQFQSSFTSGWLSLDDEDNNPNQFLIYLAASIQEATTQGNSLAVAMSSPPPALQVITTTVLNDLLAWGKPVVLVLDDYQVIRHSDIHQQMAYFIDHLPPNAYLILCTRSDPPLPLHRYRSRGQIVEVRADELRFQQGEVQLFFNQISGLPLSLTESEILFTRTEGWAAGIQLAALSVRGKNDVSTFIQSLAGTNRYILDYLAEEAFTNQPQPVQNFLIQTAVLDRLCPPLCDAVVVRSTDTDSESPLKSSQEILEYLEQANLFIIPLDQQGFWWRYHHLFLDLLHVRLKEREQKTPGNISNLHRRAAAWFETQGWQGEAIHHSIQGGDFEKAAELVEKHTTTLFSQGELHHLLDWINLLPPEYTHRPWLGVYKAWVMAFAGRIKEIEPALQPARHALETATTDANDQDRMRLELLALQGMIAVMTGNSQQAVALENLPLEDFPTDCSFARSAIHWALGYGLRMQGNPTRAIKEFQVMLKIGQATDNIWTIVTACVELGTVLRQSGNLREAEKIYRFGLQVVQQAGGSGLGFIGRLESFLANLIYERNELDEALQLVQSSIRHNRLWENSNHTVHAYWILARVLMAKGDLEQANEALGYAEEVAATSVVVPALKAGIENARLRFWIANDQLDRVKEWLDKHSIPQRDEDMRIDETVEIEMLTTARALISMGDNRIAYRLLERLETAAHSKQRVNTLIEVYNLQALSASNDNLAYTILEKAIQISEPEGFLRIFLDEGHLLKKLMQGWLSQTRKINHPKADTLLIIHSFKHIFNSFPADPSTTEPASKGLLTAREVEILTRMSEGLSNQEIGLSLHISTGTVKAHSAAIYRKLDAKNRSQAIAKAKVMGIL